jgi:hypothetical protein
MLATKGIFAPAYHVGGEPGADRPPGCGRLRFRTAVRNQCLDIEYPPLAVHVIPVTESRRHLPTEKRPPFPRRSDE